jgi:hypothetical protein
VNCTYIVEFSKLYYYYYYYYYIIIIVINNNNKLLIKSWFQRKKERKKERSIQSESNFNNDGSASGTILVSEFNAAQQTAFTAVWNWCKEFLKFAQCMSSSATFHLIKEIFQGGRKRALKIRYSFQQGCMQIHYNHLFHKVQMSLCLRTMSWRHILCSIRYNMKAYCRSGGIGPHFNLGARWRWVVSLVPWPIYQWGRDHSTHWREVWVGPTASL